MAASGWSPDSTILVFAKIDFEWLHAPAAFHIAFAGVHFDLDMTWIVATDGGIGVAALGSVGLVDSTRYSLATMAVMTE